MGRRGPLSIDRRMRPRGASEEPRSPEDLSPDCAAEWQRITGLLRERGALDALDQAAMRDYLLCWSRLHECERDISERGVLVKGDRGPVKNPSCQLARQYRDHLMGWSKELGLTPASRQRIEMPERKPDEENPFVQFRH